MPGGSPHPLEPRVPHKDNEALIESYTQAGGSGLYDSLELWCHGAPDQARDRLDRRLVG